MKTKVKQVKLVEYLEVWQKTRSQLFLLLHLIV